MLDLYRKYRILIIVLLLACTAGVWELTDPDPAATRQSEQLPYVMLDLYPESADILYALGMQQVLNGNLKEARAKFERALAMGDYTNEDLLYFYALTLVRMNADEAEIDAAVASWKFHFPHSARHDPRVGARGAQAAATR